MWLYNTCCWLFFHSNKIFIYGRSRRLGGLKSCAEGSQHSSLYGGYIENKVFRAGGISASTWSARGAFMREKVKICHTIYSWPDLHSTGPHKRGYLGWENAVFILDINLEGLSVRDKMETKAFTAKVTATSRNIDGHIFCGVKFALLGRFAVVV